MIGLIAGEVLENQDGRILITVGDRKASGAVGYSVTVPQNSSYEGIGVGKRAELLIYTHVREDTLDLYGFVSKLEKTLFLTLLGVSGIGPKSALGILSAADPAKLVDAIVRGDQEFLTRLPGIGKKTAERVVVELRDSIRKKVNLGDLASLKSPSGKFSLDPSSELVEGHETGMFRDASAALIGLGYKDHEVQQLLSRILQTETPTPKRAEDLIRSVLREVGLR